MAPSPSFSPSPRTSIYILSLLSLILFAASLSPCASAYQLGGVRGLRKKAGGWTEIPDAASNLEMRELGRYSVDEYNHQLRDHGKAPISFSGVLSAQSQVVSGIKYHIRFATVHSRDGHHLTFDAVVLSHPWILKHSRDLLSFTPSDD